MFGSKLKALFSRQSRKVRVEAEFKYKVYFKISFPTDGDEFTETSEIRATVLAKDQSQAKSKLYNYVRSQVRTVVTKIEEEK